MNDFFYVSLLLDAGDKVNTLACILHSAKSRFNASTPQEGKMAEGGDEPSAIAKAEEQARLKWRKGWGPASTKLLSLQEAAEDPPPGNVRVTRTRAANTKAPAVLTAEHSMPPELPALRVPRGRKDRAGGLDSQPGSARSGGPQVGASLATCLKSRPICKRRNKVWLK